MYEGKRGKWGRRRDAVVVLEYRAVLHAIEVVRVYERNDNTDFAVGTVEKFGDADNIEPVCVGDVAALDAVLVGSNTAVGLQDGMDAVVAIEVNRILVRSTPLLAAAVAAGIRCISRSVDAHSEGSQPVNSGDADWHTAGQQDRFEELVGRRGGWRHSVGLLPVPAYDHEQTGEQGGWDELELDKEG